MFAKAAILWLDRCLLRLDYLLAGAAAASVAIMMLLTSLDVGLRYALNSPLSWVYDVTMLYLLPAAFIFGFSFTLRSNNHINVDFFARWLPTPIRGYSSLITSLAAGAIFLYITIITAAVAWDAWVANEVMFGTLNWPIWPSKLIIPLGMALLSLRCFHSVLCSLIPSVELDPVHEHLTEEL